MIIKGAIKVQYQFLEFINHKSLQCVLWVIVKV